MRARLAIPFLWSAEQAIEKYLKCILMLNRQKTHDLSHDIAAALAQVNRSLPFSIILNKGEQQVFDHIAQCHGDRYLIHSLSLDDYELLQLDHLVWHLRQYCRPLNVRHYADTPSEQVLLERVREVKEGMIKPPKHGRIDGAFLEKILEDKKHPAHKALVWQNLMFSLSSRKSLKFRDNWQAINAPLWLNPELAEEAAKWMKIPKFVLKAASKWAKEKEDQLASHKKE